MESTGYIIKRLEKFVNLTHNSLQRLNRKADQLMKIQDEMSLNPRPQAEEICVMMKIATPNAELTTKRVYQIQNLRLDDAKFNIKWQEIMIKMETIEGEIKEAIEHQVKDFRKCFICRTNEIRVMTIPCGHLCYCENCAEKIKRCNVCDTNVREKIVIYLP